ncbi:MULTISPECIES: aminoglycoside 6'-N-acetyltransferase [Stenotrophomonas]|uniref:aminoglycoside 6'-N-acetyltransferase n=1 Tax=Stenotrophomonas TaxID=40323 RepID=UPI00081BC7A1|nr:MULTISPECIES: aminoglycoside 6'-N-acetyltransferase [Stenotrophomonas]
MKRAGVDIRRALASDWSAWAQLRRGLWADCETDLAELQQLLEEDGGTVLLAFAQGQPVGLAEASLRHDYVNGTSSSPVGFLEGWYVIESQRGLGIGRALVAEVARWARAQGCSELASDTALDNTHAQAAHKASGFVETERVVYYCMSLDAPAE